MSNIRQCGGKSSWKKFLQNYWNVYNILASCDGIIYMAGERVKAQLQSTKEGFCFLAPDLLWWRRLGFLLSSKQG